MTNYLDDDVRDKYLLGLRIRSPENVQDVEVGIIIRRRDQMTPGVLGKDVQANARFGLSNRLEVHLDHARLPAGNVKGAEKTKGRSLNILRAIKRSSCLVHALIITMAKVNMDPKYKSYTDGYVLKQPVKDLLSASGIN